MRTTTKRRAPSPISDSTLSDPPTPIDEGGPVLNLKALKKVQELRKHAHVSPFPNHARPTPEECRLVATLLSKSHHVWPQSPRILSNMNSKTRIEDTTTTTTLRESRGASCGEVPDVLDALIRTILSQNTSNLNSRRAKQSLDKVFGKGNYEAVRQASQPVVCEAIKCGGLAEKKSSVIKKILDEVYQKYGELSLKHLTTLSDSEVMETLVSFNGVGPKTASCVLLFCLQRPSFAVDTHVFRLSKSLGWVPCSATRDQTFAHLNLKIPDELKYTLHSLLIRHGRGCRRCSADGKVQKGDTFEGTCPLIGISKTKEVPLPNKDDDIDIKIEEEVLQPKQEVECVINEELEDVKVDLEITKFKRVKLEPLVQELTSPRRSPRRSRITLHQD